tara:strand:+ start:108 stop:803 length:696 start_codon:yes stop_codon:yes gene_type:complete
MAKRIKPILGLAGGLVAGGLMLAAAGTANATIVGYTGCTGANSCDVTTTPPDPVTQDPNDGILLGWNEVQNTTLAADLRVDRVFDEGASFVEADGSGFIIKAGTIVSSHYFQWDPGNGSAGTVEATINLDSQVFAFITDTQKLFDSDAALGLSALDYNDFGLRGLESGDTTNFNGENVDIDWTASSPGDWTRLITAFSPAAAIPEPGALAPFGLGLAAFAGLRIARRKRAA